MLLPLPLINQSDAFNLRIPGRLVDVKSIQCMNLYNTILHAERCGHLPPNLSEVFRVDTE